jgi:hypothetical protein
MRNKSSFFQHRLLGRQPLMCGARLLTTLGFLLLLLLHPSLLFSYELGERVQTFTLKNGLRLLMLERHLSPTVTIYIRYRAGAG